MFSRVVPSETIVEICARASASLLVRHPDRTQRALDRQAGAEAIARRDPHRPLEQFIFGNDLRNQAHLMGTRGRHPLMGAEKRDTQHLAERQLLQEVHRLEAGHHPVRHMGSKKVAFSAAMMMSDSPSM